ncbi:hypothetical protein HMPREF1546_01544 [Oscillibacter sp. KLE 1745]|nr:hypothetical protein HMPREF1546_01544 [Oscillibacter sp. KLE 1745]
MKERILTRHDQGHVMVCENCKKTQRVLTVKHKTSERLSILLSEK